MIWYRCHIIFVLIILAMSSCTSAVEEHTMKSDADLADVFLIFDVSGEQHIDIASKSVNDPDGTVDADDLIRNLWIIQFDGISDDSVVLGDPTYIEDFSSFDGTAKLVATDDPSAVVFIANTFEDKSKFIVSQGMTLKDLKGRTKKISGENGMLGQDDSDGYHLICNGTVNEYDGIAEGETLNVALKRNVARIRVLIRNNAQGTVTVNSVQICSVPDVSYYMADLSAVTEFPEYRTLSVMDFAEKVWSHGQDVMEFTAYLPVNQRGVSSSTSEFTKNRYAPEYATYLKIEAEYMKDGVQCPVIYRFYLGENLVDDFNIRPNHAYTYEFSINSIGNSEVDSRIEDWGLVDFSDSRYEVSNCYILNPLPAGVSGQRHFRIPIQRAKTFWGTEIRQDYENDERLGLRGNVEWKAFVLASDFVMTDDDFSIVCANGNSHDDRYFEVAVGSGVRGNVIVGVGPEEGEVSWSWHLWITDYNPYECLDWGVGRENEYVYPVENGHVHRYEGAYWESNTQCYIMDRNLGAMSVDYPSDNRGLVYYQFGRKDPFFYHLRNSSVYYYPVSGSDHRWSFVSYQDANDASKGNAVAYSVKNPLSFVGSYNLPGDSFYNDWTLGNKYNPSEFEKSMIWQDPLTVEGASRQGEKSLFDPCPPGFRVPDARVWSDFRSNDNEKRTTNSFSDKNAFDSRTMQSGFGLWLDMKGLQYWPYQGENVRIPSQDVVYYPASGFAFPGDGNSRNDAGVETDFWAFVWADTPQTLTYGYGMTAQNDHLKAQNNTSRGRGLPVRCITDR